MYIYIYNTHIQYTDTINCEIKTTFTLYYTLNYKNDYLYDLYIYIYIYIYI